MTSEQQAASMADARIIETEALLPRPKRFVRELVQMARLVPVRPVPRRHPAQVTEDLLRMLGLSPGEAREISQRPLPSLDGRGLVADLP
jgi:hypothetical protein